MLLYLFQSKYFTSITQQSINFIKMNMVFCGAMDLIDGFVGKSIFFVCDQHLTAFNKESLHVTICVHIFIFLLA